MVDAYARIEQRTLDRFIPFKVDWELTYRCNERCIHCYQCGPSAEPELTAKEARAILDQLAAKGCLYLTFTGGEILLRDDFLEIAGYARKKGFALRLFTNGTLIDRAMALKIKAVNPLSVEISLYSTRRDVHERMTRLEGSFDKTTQAFRLLREEGVPVVLKCTVTRENCGEVKELRAFAETLGCGYSFSFTVIPRVDGSADILGLRLDERWLKDLLGADPYFTKGISLGGVRNYKPLCAAGFNSLYISPYAEVFPCVCLRQSCGNLRKQRLDEIWRSEVLSRIRGITYDDLHTCVGCECASYCDRCMGLAWMESGDMLGVSPHDCALARVRREAVEARRRYGEEKEETVQKTGNSLRA